MQYIRNLLNYKELLWELVRRDLKVKYRRSFLGYLWSLLNPLLMMIVVSTVFSYMFRFDIENYPIYLLTGQIFFNFFSESTNLAMGSIVQGGGLIRKVYLPKYIFPLSRVLSCFTNFLFSLIAIVIMLVITKTPVTIAIIEVPISLLYILMFSIGAGMALSIFATYFRDTMHLWGVVITAWMYFTPIFYPTTLLPEKARLFMSFNPMFHMIENFRATILYGYFPSLKSHIICFTFAVLSLIIGSIIFKKYQDKLILYI